MKARLFVSLLAGMAVAAILVAFEAKYRHSALVASAAKPQPHGVHETVTSILVDGFIGATLIAGLVVFVLATVVAASRKARQPVAQRAFQQGRPARRRPRADVWR